MILSKNHYSRWFHLGSNGYTDRLEINGKNIELFRKSADESYIPLLEIPLVAGRNFISSDGDNGIIVNEAFVKKAGLDYAVGAQIQINDYNEKFTRTIVGVTKDYHYNSPASRFYQ
jgi:putative ABC transport system permease protein